MLEKIKEKVSLKILALFIMLICTIAANSAYAVIKSYKKDANGVIFFLDKGQMQIRVCSADIIEVKYTMLAALSQKSSLVVNNTWAKKVNFKVEEINGNIIITTGILTLFCQIIKCINL